MESFQGIIANIMVAGSDIRIGYLMLRKPRTWDCSFSG